MFRLCLSLLLLWTHSSEAAFCWNLFPILASTKPGSIGWKVRAAGDSYDGSDLYTIDDRRMLAEIWQSDLPDSDKAKRTFDVYADARLRGIPPEAARFARRTLKQFEWEREKKGWAQVKAFELADATCIDGIYSPQVGMFVPEYAGADGAPSLLHYFMLAHEFEHAVQEGLARSQGVTREQIAQAGKAVQYRFLQEKSAMMAETLYLRAIPNGQSVLQEFMQRRASKEGKTLDAFRAQGKPDRLALRFALDHLDTGFDPRKYVRSQWRSERYSLPRIREMIGRKTAARLIAEVRWVSTEGGGHNFTQPDKAYLSLWERTKRQLGRAILRIPAPNDAMNYDEGTLKEYRDSLFRMLAVYQDHERDLLLLQRSLLKDKPTTPAAEAVYQDEIKSLAERRAALLNLVREIEIGIFSSYPQDMDLPEPRSRTPEKP